MKKLLFLSFLSLLALNLSSQTTKKEPFIREKGCFSLGINPTYPFLNGYGVHVFYNLPKSWSFGIVSEGAFKLPESATKQFFKNGDALNVNWDYAIGLEARYRFNRKDNDIKGLYAYTSFGYEAWAVTKSDDSPTATGFNQEDKFDNFYSSIGMGYNLFPLKNKGFWLGASYGVIYIMNNTSDRTVNNSTYNIRPIVPPSFIPNIYIGWRFGKSN
jgi:hypothetical protein